MKSRSSDVIYIVVGVLLVVILIIIIIIIILIILIYTRRRKKKVDFTNGNKIHNYIIINYHAISNNLGTEKETIDRCVYVIILYKIVYLY